MCCGSSKDNKLIVLKVIFFLKKNNNQVLFTLPFFRAKMNCLCLVLKFLQFLFDSYEVKMRFAVLFSSSQLNNIKQSEEK